MKTDALNPRTLQQFLEIYGLEKVAYLALYLTSYELYQNHIVGIDCEQLNDLLDGPWLEENDMTVRLCMATNTAAEVLILSRDEGPEVLVVKPSAMSSVEGCALFGLQIDLELIQRSLGGLVRPGSGRPIQ